MIYHYTKQIQLASILTKGLKPTNLNAPREKPVNWFSKNPTWERTVFLSAAPGLAEAYEWAKNVGGIARLACDDRIAPHRWQEICDIAGIKAKVAKGLVEAARRGGARPWEWRGTLEIVPVEQFRSIETYDGTAWRAHSIDEAVQISVEVNSQFEMYDRDYVRRRTACHDSAGVL